MKIENVITVITERLTESFIPYWDEALLYENQPWQFEITNNVNAIERARLNADIHTYVMRGNNVMVTKLTTQLIALQDLPIIPKPSLAEVMAELANYQEELQGDEDLRQAEADRIADIKARFANVKDFHACMKEKGKEFSANPALVLKRILEENDQELLTALEEGHVIVKGKKDSELVRANRKNLGAKKKEVCTALLDIVRGFNSESEASEEAIDAMEEGFDSIFNALNKGRPSKARRLIELVTDPSVAELKVLLLEELTELGF